MMVQGARGAEIALRASLHFLGRNARERVAGSFGSASLRFEEPPDAFPR